MLSSGSSWLLLLLFISLIYSIIVSLRACPLTLFTLLKEHASLVVRKPFELVKRRLQFVSPRARGVHDPSSDGPSTSNAKSDCFESLLLCENEIRVVTVRRRVVSCGCVLRLYSRLEGKFEAVEANSGPLVVGTGTRHVLQLSVQPFHVDFLVVGVRNSKALAIGLIVKLRFHPVGRGRRRFSTHDLFQPLFLSISKGRSFRVKCCGQYKHLSLIVRPYFRESVSLGE